MSCVAKKDVAHRATPQTAARRAASKRNPTKRLRFGKEEQRNERALTFEKSRSKRYEACSDVSLVDKKMHALIHFQKRRLSLSLFSIYKVPIRLRVSGRVQLIVF